MEEHDPVEVMRRIKQVIGLAIMGVEGDMHKEVMEYAPIVSGTNGEKGEGADTRRFYEVVGFDIMLLALDRGEEEPVELRPTILEVNFNPDPSLYHKEDIGPKGGAFNDIVSLAGLLPGSAPRSDNYSLEELKAMVGLANLTECSTTSESEPGQPDYVKPQAGEDGMQIWEKVYSMRYSQKLFPIKPLECVTRYDLELAVEHDAERARAKGYEVVLPSADMGNYHQFMKSNRYADMLLQRLLVTPREANYSQTTAGEARAKIAAQMGEVGTKGGEGEGGEGEVGKGGGGRKGRTKKKKAEKGERKGEL